MTFIGILTTAKTEPQKSYLNYMHIPSFILGLKCLVLVYLISNSLGDENKANSEWWSLQPIQKKSPPQNNNKELIKNSIDLFIQKYMFHPKIKVQLHFFGNHFLTLKMIPKSMFGP